MSAITRTYSEHNCEIGYDDGYPYAISYSMQIYYLSEEIAVERAIIV